jgi:hypothetical protein
MTRRAAVKQRTRAVPWRLLGIVYAVFLGLYMLNAAGTWIQDVTASMLLHRR